MGLENKIKKLYENLELKTILEERVITILKIIVLDKKDDLEEIALIANSTVETITKYINSKELMLKFLNEEEYSQFIPYRDYLNNSKRNKKEQEKYNIYKSIINDIFETRYLLGEILIKNNVSKSVYERLMSDTEYLSTNFGEGIIDKIKNRINETSLIRTSTPRNRKVIEEPWDLKVVKDEIHNLGNYEYKMLNTVSNYIMSGANINYVMNKLDMSEQIIYNYITDSNVKELIKEKYFDKLQNYIEFENILRGQSLSTKKNLIKQVVSALKQSNYVIADACKISGIPVGLMERILNNDLIFIIYSRDEIENFRELFSNSEKSKKK